MALAFCKCTAQFEAYSLQTHEVCCSFYIFHALVMQEATAGAAQGQIPFGHIAQEQQPPPGQEHVLLVVHGWRCACACLVEDIHT